MTEAGTFRDFTPSERRIWIGQQLAPDVPLYNMAMAFEIEGNIEPERFSRAFRLLAQSHDMLRSVVARGDGQPGFELLAGPPQDITLEALETGPGIDDPPVREWLEKLAATRIHLDRSPYDSRLIALGSERWVWFLNQHHLVTDVSSCELLFRRLGRIYESLKSGVEAEVDWPQAWHVLQSRRAEPADRVADLDRRFGVG